VENKEVLALSSLFDAIGIIEKGIEKIYHHLLKSKRIDNLNEVAAQYDLTLKRGYKICAVLNELELVQIYDRPMKIHLATPIIPLWQKIVNKRIEELTNLFQEQKDRDADPKNVEDINFIQKEANDLAEKHNFLPLFSKVDIIKIIDRHDPGIITINAIISALQSHETVKILHWIKGNKSLGDPIMTYNIFNGMTMRFYPIEKKRNIQCLQCGDQVRRVYVDVNRNARCEEIINSLTRMGFMKNPEMEPTLTTMDFNDINIVDLDLTPIENNLRTLELITAVGFNDGEIFITLNII